MATLQEPQFDLEAGCGGGDNTIPRPISSNCSEESITITTEIAGLLPKEVAASVSDLALIAIGSGDYGGGEGSKDCRICHLSLGANMEESENGIAIELGCCCKDDLAAVHKHCAEAWFKIKGNRTCEICGSIARNIAEWNDSNGSTPSRAIVAGAIMARSQARNFWQGHGFLNFLLALIFFIFVMSWLFHYDIPS